MLRDHCGSFPRTRTTIFHPPHLSGSGELCAHEVRRVLFREWISLANRRKQFKQRCRCDQNSVSGRRCPSWSWARRAAAASSPAGWRRRPTPIPPGSRPGPRWNSRSPKISSRISPRTLRTSARRRRVCVIASLSRRITAWQSPRRTGLSADKRISGFLWKRPCRAARMSGRRLLAARWRCCTVMA